MIVPREIGIGKTKFKVSVVYSESDWICILFTAVTKFGPLLIRPLEFIEGHSCGLGYIVMY